MESSGAELYRRSLYTFWKRTVPYPTLSIFDVPDREVCVVQRLLTDNTPLQAASFMNDPVQLEAARKLAERMLLEGRQHWRRTTWLRISTHPGPFAAPRGSAPAFRALGKTPVGLPGGSTLPPVAYLAVGASKPEPALDPVELAAYANLASLILNLDEAITRN